MTKAAFGLIGLGTMGRNLALNIESRGVSVAVWNREQDWTDRFVAEGAARMFDPQLVLPVALAAHGLTASCRACTRRRPRSR